MAPGGAPNSDQLNRDKIRDRLLRRTPRGPQSKALSLTGLSEHDHGSLPPSPDTRNFVVSSPQRSPVPRPSRHIVRVDSSASISAQPFETRAQAIRSCLKQRPEAQELYKRRILKDLENDDYDESLNTSPNDLAPDSPALLPRPEVIDKLTHFLITRPTPSELSPRILQFQSDVHVYSTFCKSEYNRKPDPGGTYQRLTPKLKMEIREELNRFKEKEMAVHESSAKNTAFH